MKIAAFGNDTTKCFNRTFMELKYRTYKDNAKTPKGFNRTFMELKFGIELITKRVELVLIVPLWN